MYLRDRKNRRDPKIGSGRPVHILLFQAAAIAGYLLAGLVYAAPAAAQFVPGIADLPMLEGLAAEPGGPVVFDTPEGRIVTTSLTGAIAEKAVRDFYGATLPQLGWQKLAAGHFRREGEILKLTIFPLPGNRIRLRFSLAPVPGPPSGQSP